MLSHILLSACLTLLPADAPDAESLPVRVRRLVRQLDDASLAQRDAAERALVELGPAAYDQLPTPTANASAEVKLRLGRVRQALETAAAEAAAQPALVTLRGEMPLSEALAAVEKQTGNRIVDFRCKFGQERTDPRVTTDFADTPFWPALDRLLDQTRLTTYPFSGEVGAVALVARDEQESARAGRGAYSGLFRFEGVRIQGTRDLRIPTSPSLRLTFEVAWEPRVSPIVLQIPVGIVKAVDDAGRPIEVNATTGSLEVPVESGIPAAEVHLPLTLPERGAAKIASLQGQLAALVPGRTETFEFGDLQAAKSVEQRRADVTVVLEQVRKNVDAFEVRVRVRFAQAENALESHRNWVYGNPAYVLTAAGEQVEHGGYQAFRQAADEVGVAYVFDLPAGLAGCKFVYKTPAVLRNLPIAYELKDIPLP